MAVYIDTDYIDAHIKSDVRTALFTDSGAYSSTAIAQVIVTASERVKLAGEQAGYSMGSTSTDEMVKQATLGQFIALAYGRNGLPIPEQFYTEIRLADLIRDGKIKLSGTPASEMTVGGSYFTPSDPDDTTGIADGTTIPAIFKNLRNLW